MRKTEMPAPRVGKSAAPAVAIVCLFAGCVDLQPPWEKVTANGGAGGDAGTGGAPAIDGPVAAGGSYEAGMGGGIDLGSGGLGGAGGNVDAPLGGTIEVGRGGAGGGTGGAGIDLPISGTGGTVVPLDGGDAPLAGSGGGGAGGASRTGGVSGTGGGTPSGGTTGAGGATVRDAGPDLAPDLPSDATDAPSLLAGLVAYYPCESPSGTTLTDMSGKGNHGTLRIGAVLDGGTPPSETGYGFVGGKVGTGALALFQAGHGYVSLPPAIFANATDITIAFWLNVTTSQSWQRVLDTGVYANLPANSRTGTKYLNFVPKNGGSNLLFSITVNGYGNEQTLSAASLPTGTWKHVAVVLAAGAGGRLYVDGVEANANASLALRPLDLGAIDYAFIGKSQFDADPYFDGMIDEIRVYSRALSAADVQALYGFTGS